ncbi:MAG TPA: c-type cytochrome [Bryobacteraceae bacterium]|jgi:cytochrome c oxidase cbb3-type subunit 3|nr:c-type cytochrome [Bryobacteraceae bacterium]
MQAENFLVAAVLAGLTIAVPPRAVSQGSTPAATTPAPATPAPAAQVAPGTGGRRFGGFVPGQHRPPGDPVQIAHGKALFAVNCVSCHGVDLRGGDLGGPNLLRSHVSLSDQNGELILPIIQGSRQDEGMPAIPIDPQDGLAVAAYIRSVVETIGSQGRPPSLGKEAPSILVGDASTGQAYFTAKCGSCHSATGDLQGIAARITDPKILQTNWVAGGGRRRRMPAPGAASPRTATVSVTLASGEKVEGRLIRIDDFLVTVGLADGAVRTFRRDEDVPKVEVHDPMKAHRDLMAVYTDKDIHDVTAYLVTLK